MDYLKEEILGDESIFKGNSFQSLGVIIENALSPCKKRISMEQEVEMGSGDMVVITVMKDER